MDVSALYVATWQGALGIRFALLDSMVIVVGVMPEGTKYVVVLNGNTYSLKSTVPFDVIVTTTGEDDPLFMIILFSTGPVGS